MLPNKLEEAADLHRRWTGVGIILFVVFYSLFFAAHLKVEKSMVYLKNDVVLSIDTATFYSDLTAPREQAGAGGIGKGNAFLLLHHEMARLIVAAWEPFAGSQSSARRHGVATLTAGAGAMMVVFLYLALLWSGVSRMRATLLAAILGISTAGLVFSVLPQPYIFAAMGFMAALAAVARGQAGGAWEFGLAALYTACCSFWHVIPLLLIALVRGARASSGGSDMRPVVQAFVSAILLGVVSLGAMKIQTLFYPRSGGVEATEMLQTVGDSLGKAGQHTAHVSWGEKLKDVFLTNVAAPRLVPQAESAVTASSATVQAGAVEHVAQESGSPWFVPNLQYGIWAVWLGLLLAGFIGLPMAFREQDAVLAGLLVAIWFVWLDGVMVSADARLLHSVLWTPALVLLIGVGLEQYVDRWDWLRWPLTIALSLFLGLEAQRNIAFFNEIARIVTL